MNSFKMVLFVLLIFTASTISAQNRVGAVNQIKTLSAAPGSLDPTLLPPDGRPWIIFIFKACCSPADQAARWIVNTQETYGDKVGVVGINVDRSRTIHRVNNWLKTRNINFPVVSDITTQVALSWGVIAPPTIVILDNQAHEVYRTMGYQPSYGEQLTKELEKLLATDLRTEDKTTDEQ